MSYEYGASRAALRPGVSQSTELEQRSLPIEEPAMAITAVQSAVEVSVLPTEEAAVASTPTTWVRRRVRVVLPDAQEWRANAVCETTDEWETFTNPQYQERAKEQCGECFARLKCLAQSVELIQSPDLVPFQTRQSMLKQTVLAGFTKTELQQKFEK